MGHFCICFSFVFLLLFFCCFFNYKCTVLHNVSNQETLLHLLKSIFSNERIIIMWEEERRKRRRRDEVTKKK